MSSNGMGTRDGVNATGVLELWIEDVEGALLHHILDRNLVVDSGLAMLSGGLADLVTDVAVGTNGAASAAGDVAPLTDQFAKGFTSVEHPIGNATKFNFEIGLGECNGMVIREFGLLRVADEAVTLCARKGEKNIAKTSDFSIRGEWTITLQ
jgi:hypothetical protein